MDTVLLYVLAGAAFLGSYIKDREKTRQGLIKAGKVFENILPSFLTILFIIGIMLGIVSPAMISSVFGKDSGVPGLLLAGALGLITLIPGFIAFPLAKAALDMGAGILQTAVFVTTLMMVGIVTAPLESEFFNVRIMLYRNGLSFIFAFMVAAVLWLVVSR